MEKFVLVGLDGVGWNVIKPWIDKGFLPTFKRLMDNGVWGVLKSTIPSLTSPAIPSFFTGKNPAKLGFFSFLKPDGSIMTYRDIKEPSIWDILGEYGYKSIIINLRTTYPPKKINGIMISGFPPSEESEYTYPPEIKNMVKGFHIGTEKLVKLWKKGKLKKGLMSFIIERMWKRYKIIKNLITKYEYDFLLYWIGETDTIQHWYWHNKDKLLTFFQEVDKLLNNILEDFRYRNLFIISDHGFCGPPLYNFYINSWLKECGYLKLKGNKYYQWFIQTIYSIAENKKIKNFFLKFLEFKNKIFFKNYKNQHYYGKDSIWNKRRNLFWGVDYNNTIAIAYGGNTVWGINILKENLKEDYEKIREEIINKLKNLKINGKKVVKDVWKREELFKGDLSIVPDIVYLPSEDVYVSILLSKNVLIKRKKIDPRGTHEKAVNGIFLAYGKDIKKGLKLGEIQIYDIAPTILHLFNIPIPEDIDGRVLKEIFKENSEPAVRPVVYQKITEKDRIKGKIKKLRLLRKI